MGQTYVAVVYYADDLQTFSYAINIIAMPYGWLTNVSIWYVLLLFHSDWNAIPVVYGIQRDMSVTSQM